MEPLRELIATDHRQTLEFFVCELRDVSEPSVDRDELLYNASVLAHFAQTSTGSIGDLPSPSHLGEVFDQFVLDTSMWRDSDLMETAAAQCLLLAGFFEDQMRQRHSIRWYAELGAGFFMRAATCEASPKKARLLGMLGVGFEAWRQRHARLGREFRVRPYILPFNENRRAM
jgi:hypothetical protein